MHVSLETLRSHIEYTAWASGRILEAASALTEEELSRDFGTADKSVLGTLLHVYGADWAWIERMDGRSPKGRPFGDDATLQWLGAEWPRVWDRWRAHVATLTPESAEAEVAYTTFKGDAFRSPAWQIVMHVVNHATHHRGQAAGFLRSLGKVPPVLD